MPKISSARFYVRLFFLLCLLALLLLLLFPSRRVESLEVGKSIRLPDGFRIKVYSADVPGARSLALGEGGTVFVGTRHAGKIYALVDENLDYEPDRVITIASGLDTPNGVAFRDGDLYVVETSRILRFEGIERRLSNPPEAVVVYDGLPRERHHGWKFTAFGPDGRLYVPIGAPCNVCAPQDPRFSTITRMRPDGSGFEIFAHGVRNSVGFDWHPETKELWFTDNGRDWLGDDSPPDELNNAPRAGLHFGFPFCHAGTVADPEFGKGKDCRDYVSPARRLGPHVAALGMRFYTGEMFPPEYRGQIFVAEHGSWNRNTPIGYRVSLVRLEGGAAESYEPFASGWLTPGGAVLGRPVDLLVLGDGSLLVSDDHRGAIYRITYETPANDGDDVVHRAIGTPGE